MFNKIIIYYYDNNIKKTYSIFEDINFLPIKGMLLTINNITYTINKVEFNITLNTLYLKVTKCISLSDEYYDDL